ncbi:hypothetical protein Tco_1116787, partial [Tanacetum coccineum]
VDMIGIPRTIMVRGKPFNTEHTLNKYKHIKPVKKKKRELAPERNEPAKKWMSSLRPKYCEKSNTRHGGQPNLDKEK